MDKVNRYEWENPIMPGDVFMMGFVLAFLFTFGKILVDVLRQEKNFAEIIDIINDSLVISSEGEQSNLYLN